MSIKYPATMMTYINEESSVFKTVINEYQHSLVSFIEYTKTHQIKRCLILATGSSYNAALCAKYSFEHNANILVEIKEPFTFDHYEKLDPKIDMVIAISQSGKSSSTIVALDKIKAAQIPIFVLTANIDSPISKKADYVLDINCGIETVGFVTKGFLMTVLNLQLMALILAKQNYSFTVDKYTDAMNQLELIGSHLDRVIQQTLAFFSQHKSALTQYNRFVAISYGPSFGVVKEFETKFTETVRQPSNGFELEAYMHGPYLEANKQHCLFFVDDSCNDNQYQRSKQLKQYMSEYVGQTLTVSVGKLDYQPTSCELNIDLNIDNYLQPLLAIIPFQILAYQIATAKGIDLSVKIFSDFDTVLKSKI